MHLFSFCFVWTNLNEIVLSLILVNRKLQIEIPNRDMAHMWDMFVEWLMSRDLVGHYINIVKRNKIDVYTNQKGNENVYSDKRIRWDLNGIFQNKISQHLMLVLIYNYIE